MLVRMDVLGLLCKNKMVAESLSHRGTTDFELRWGIDNLVWHRTLAIHLVETSKDSRSKVD
jgi:hypothetical protein